MPRRSCLLSLLLLALLLLAAPVAAQENPDVARGFSADKLYQFGELDSVNLFNGNLTLALPLGPGYSAGGGLSYSLTLAYNSNVWDFEEHWDPVSGADKTKAIPRR